ncbi:hypothetical protein J7905_01490 [Vibrio parahaemolyticus]|nr:hypothetical protein [Vibrio parahaemolyticus]EJG1296115.1 hypothetical protein [Vibrio parahaemolyticus]EJG1329211.1 hypothetical protein [Vibrio parahaemolyticus]MCF9341181.1 hypothetical protein [Vibrio parahaemolyticus]MCF9346826.1 hypothetical protein [Vibrio parahaemolyticus]
MKNAINADKVFYEFHCATDFNDYNWKSSVYQCQKNREYKLISNYTFEEMWDMILNDDDAACVNIFEQVDDEDIGFETHGSVYFNAVDGHIYGEVYYSDLDNIDCKYRADAHAVLQSVVQATVVATDGESFSDYFFLGYLPALGTPYGTPSDRPYPIKMVSLAECVRWENDASFDDNGEAYKLNKPIFYPVHIKWITDSYDAYEMKHRCKVA